MTVTYLSLNAKLSDLRSLVFPADPIDKQSKLTYRWTAWTQTDVDQGDYKEATKPLVSFETIGSFWSTFNHIPQPSSFFEDARVERSGSRITALMIFREGVSPEWEDPANAEGGHFQFHWRTNGIAPEQLDEYWNNLVLAMVGHTIESEGEFSTNPIVQGVRFVDKLSGSGKQAGARIEIWFSKPVDQRHLQKIRSRLEKGMSLRLDGSTGTVPKCDVKYHCNRK